MTNKKFFELLKDIAVENEVELTDLYRIMEKAFVKAYEKEFGSKSCKVIINPDKNEILLYSVYRAKAEPQEVTEDGIIDVNFEEARKYKPKGEIYDGLLIEVPVNMHDFGRAAARATKEMYTQDLTTLLRERAYEYFVGREGEMVIGDVLDVNDRFVTLSLAKNVTTTLPCKELLVNDSPKVGSKLRVFIKKVEKGTKGPKIFVTRNDRNLITRLMETYIPEIKEGIVEIKGIARDAGDRTKIAVYSNDKEIDARGSCIGEGGERIKNVVDALNGEKIDLYEWSEDVEKLIANSLQPASVTKVLSIDVKNKSSIVLVPDDQLSLAIGKSGQNVRLAVQSCGWKIDIKSLKQAFDEGLIDLS